LLVVRRQRIYYSSFTAGEDKAKYITMQEKK